MDLNERILGQLSDLETQGELRHLEPIQGVDLSSNDYLGLSTDPRMKLAVLEGMNSAPRVASTGSRLLSGHDEVWTRLEDEFGRWVGAEAALYFTSGYAANVGLLGAILQPDDIVFSDSANHASLIDGIRLSKCRRVVFPHLDLDALEAGLSRNQRSSGARIIVVESVYSMEGDRTPLADLATLAARYGAELIIDEAHATGVRGSCGSGCVAEAGLSGRVLASVHTCGKALAAAGAFVCGSANLRRFLINRARTFVYSTGLPPHFAAQVAAGMKLAADAGHEREQLAELGAFLRHELKQNGFDTGASDTQIVPVILGPTSEAIRIAEHLRAKGFGIRAIRPPTVPAGTARLRLSLTAKMSRDTLAGLVNAIVEARGEYSSARVASATP